MTLAESPCGRIARQPEEIANWQRRFGNRQSAGSLLSVVVPDAGADRRSEGFAREIDVKLQGHGLASRPDMTPGLTRLRTVDFFLRLTFGARCHRALQDRAYLRSGPVVRARE